MKNMIFLISLLLLSQALNAKSCPNSLNALDSLKAKAKSGDVAAMWEVGNWYLEAMIADDCYDRIVKMESAEYWLLKAYKKDKNNAKGLYCLGRLNYFETKDNKGKKFLTKSAELGNIDAALFLFAITKSPNSPSIFHPNKEWGKKRKENDECKRYASLALSITPNKEFASYTQLADAAGWLGDVTRQKQYAIKALNNGEIDAISYMASHNIMPNDDTEPRYLYKYADYIRRHARNFGVQSAAWVSLYHKSAQKGYAPAQIKMGHLYLQGYGQEVKKDTLKAIAWYKESAKNGNTIASVILAIFYLQGLYHQKDPELAFDMFKQAVETAETDKTNFTSISASYLVGLCYSFGLGVKKDNSYALDYLLSATEKQRKTFFYTDIAYVIGIIYYELGDVRALDFLKKYIDSPINTSNYLRRDAIKKVSVCYRLGKCGAQKDVSLANKYDSIAQSYGASLNQNIMDTIMERTMSILLKN